MMPQPISDIDGQWIEREFATVDLSDDRLTGRFLDVAKSLAASPEKPIGQACGSKARLKGAYRLFGNENFDVSELLTSHYSETSKRYSGEKTVLVIQDTSQIDYSGHKKTSGIGGLGRENTDSDRSIFFHPALALTTEGTPLGLVSYRSYTRTSPETGDREARRKKRLSKKLSEKESARWIDALEETASNFDLSKHRVINIADRECDSYAFMVAAMQKGMSFIVRSKGDRNIELPSGTLENIKSALRSQDSQATLTLEVSNNNGTEARTVLAEVKFTTAKLPVPVFASKLDLIERPKVEEISIVLVEEIDSKAKKPVSWLLITDLPISNIKDAIQVVEWYRLRWSIEIYFKILKSGCRIEDCRLQSFDKLNRYIALKAVIAFRIFYLSRVSRANPDIKCTAILPDLEWQALYMRANRTSKLPKEPPTILEAVTMIARLGGYQARKGDPPPGPIVMWRGWSVLTEALETLKIMGGSG